MENFVFGVIVGCILCAVCLNMILKSGVQNQCQKNEEDDPANWWKYGKEPFETTEED